MQLSDVPVVKGCELNSLKKDLQSFNTRRSFDIFYKRFCKC